MDEQQSLSKLRMRNKVFVVWPVGIATICLGLVGSGLVSPWWGVALGLAMVVLLRLAWTAGAVLADTPARRRDRPRPQVTSSGRRGR
jgi:membrane protein implicated in regulation of membrane protease activity